MSPARRHALSATALSPAYCFSAGRSLEPAVALVAFALEFRRGARRQAARRGAFGQRTGGRGRGVRQGRSIADLRRIFPRGGSSLLVLDGSGGLFETNGRSR